MLLRPSINDTLCMYILDWNCFHDNVCSFQSLPFSKSFREIRLEGKWVAYSAYSLQTVSGFFNFPQHFIWTRTVRRGLRVFFYTKKTRKSNRLQMSLKRQHFSSVIWRSWLRIGPAGVWNSGFPLSRPVLIHLMLTGRRFNSPVFHYQVNLRLSLQRWACVSL